MDDVCDTLLATLRPSPHHELILSIVCVNLLPATSPPTHTVDTCFVVHGRFTSPFPTSVPLVTCLLHPTPERYLPTHKHSQWIRDRAPLEVLKQSYECGELIMCDEAGGGAEVREGLITNVMVEESGVVKGCRQSGRLLGYFESLLANSDGGTAAVSVAGLKGGRYDSVFITGSSVCIAAVSDVKWLSADGSSGPACGLFSYSEASIRRVEAMRLRMLATLDRHIAEDEGRQASNGV